MQEFCPPHAEAVTSRLTNANQIGRGRSSLDRVEWTTLQVFAYLQVLDLLSTFVGFKVGASEASPFIRLLMGVAGSTSGLVVSKIIALCLAGICIYSNRFHIIRRICYWYAAVVAWNLLLLSVLDVVSK